MDDKELKMMLNTIIDEIGRSEDRLAKRIDGLELKIDAVKFSNETVELLFKKIVELETRVLKSKRKQRKNKGANGSFYIVIISTIPGFPIY